MDSKRSLHQFCEDCLTMVQISHLLGLFLIYLRTATHLSFGVPFCLHFSSTPLYCLSRENRLHRCHELESSNPPFFNPQLRLYQLAPPLSCLSFPLLHGMPIIVLPVGPASHSTHFPPLFGLTGPGCLRHCPSMR
jgi:hypothetical protein